LRWHGHADVGRDGRREDRERVVRVCALEEVADFDLPMRINFLERGDVHGKMLQAPTSKVQ
jgi:hypothetical protein